MPFAKWLHVMGLHRILSATDGHEEGVDRAPPVVELPNRKEYLGSVFAHAPYLFVLKDCSSVYQSVNPAMCQFLGKEASEIVGKTDYDLFPKSQASEHRRTDQTVVKTREPYVYFLETSGAHGRRLLSVAKTPVIDERGECIGVLCLVRDATDEEHLKHELSTLRHFNEEVLLCAHSMIVALDTEGRVIVWNEEAERITGYRSEEVEGRSDVWEVLKIDNALREAIQTMLTDHPPKGTCFRNVESRVQSKDGDESVLLWSGRTLSDESDDLRAAIAVGHDVTELKRTESQLREYAARVERLNDEKSELLSMTSHEVRTPLTAIKGFAELLNRGEGLEEEQREKVERILAQANRLENLLGNLLDISGIESKKTRLSPTEIDLNGLVKRVIHTLKPQMDEKKLSLKLVERTSPLTVHADANAVEQILTNLLSNAVSYTESNGKVVVSIADSCNYARVDVADSGIGIPLDEQERVFYEFYRTETARRLKDSGTGLGLSIVKRLVKQSGGSISVASPGEGKGSTFSFTLPRAPGEEPDSRR